jgi:hypothetical protein
VPGDIAREKQAELAQQLGTVQAQRAKLTRTSTEHEAVIRDATALLPHCGEAYRRGDDTLRRDYNQAWFEQVLVDSDRGQPMVTSVTRTGLFEGLHEAEIKADPPVMPEPGASVDKFEQRLAAGWDETGQGIDTEQPGRFRARVVHRVGGSKVALLVGDTGIEPVTSSV